jgi:hypothetical protein
MSIYTVLRDDRDIFYVGEKLSEARVTEWLAEGTLSNLMVMSGPDGFVRVRYNGKGQVLEPCMAKDAGSLSLKKEILFYIWRRKETPPSLREIGAAFGIVVSHVLYYLMALERDGMITRERYVRRSIRMTPAGEAACKERNLK